MRNMESRNMNNFKPQEEFIRNVLFMKDDDKILAVFPFYHEISENEYDMVIENFYENFEASPPKNEFCLMNESEFGWGWINKKMITHLELATLEEYNDFRKLLVSSNVIKENFILNEDA